MYTEEELQSILATQKEKDNELYNNLKTSYNDLEKRYKSVLNDSLIIFNNLRRANIKIDKLEIKTKVQEGMIKKLRIGSEHNG